MAEKDEKYTQKKGVQPPWLKGKDFKANPGNINKEGRNRKGYSKFNKELAEAGLTKVTKDKFRSTLLFLFELTEKELEYIKNDEERPQTIRIMASELLQPKTRAKYLAEIRDWALGQAKGEVEITGTIKGFDPAKVLKGAFEDEEAED